MADHNSGSKAAILSLRENMAANQSLVCKRLILAF
jgi:hypothetical protein